MFCYAHPQRETLLRCNRCERPMCTACAVLTPTGYRCKECVRGQQKIFDTAQWWDYPLAAVVAGVLAYFGSILVSFVGFFTIFLAPLAGMVIAEAVRRVLRKRRSRMIPLVAAGATLLGGLISSLINLGLIIMFSLQGGMQDGTGNLFGSLFVLLWPAVYAIVAASTVFYRLKGIRV
jgi:MFS family permease